MKYLTFLLLPCLFLFACGDDDNTVTLEEDIQKIEEYLSANGLTAESTDSGLHYIIEEEGNGTHPTLQDEITVFYTGHLLEDGSVFDRAALYPITRDLATLIDGWREGIPFFEFGGKGKLLIPSSLAYGSNPPVGIPSNAVVIFDFELVDDLPALEKERIEQYLIDNNLEADTVLPSGLHFVSDVEGMGDHPDPTDTVSIHYIGYFMDDEVFDETKAAPVDFPLEALITGWQQGIPLMKKDGRAKLFLPSNIAYGKYPPQGFPQNATLIFDIELIDFK